ncbi:uncharacterized protein LOC116610620 [Nematostella vectensis]|uniref:uncharacterized protein LOC116610620 n=1 Tax=Nematostella vectensis TaxID=45351 RepID=UPI0020775984|nr:uncharacterized protein LOC116610620 [Nematostella vectensis]
MSSHLSEIQQSLAKMDGSYGQAKRDLVMRFVRDQETLQTSQVDLKLVDDETIDLIDSAPVANEDDATWNSNLVGRECSLDSGVSRIRLEGAEETRGNTSPEPPIAPRPPSGRPQSRRRKKSATNELRVRRKSSHHKYTEDASRLTGLPTHRISSYKRDSPLALQPSLGEFEPASLNSSWPQEFLNRKFFTGSQFEKYTIGQTEVNNNDTRAEQFYSVDARPMSTQGARESMSREMLAARVRKHSANDSARISCDIKPITGARKTRIHSPTKSGGSRSRTVFNFGFNGGLELEPVHPTDLSMLRVSSASGSGGGPYSLVQLPPIAREPAPAASPPFS